MRPNSLGPAARLQQVEHLRCCPHWQDSDFLRTSRTHFQATFQVEGNRDAPLGSEAGFAAADAIKTSEVLAYGVGWLIESNVDLATAARGTCFAAIGEILVHRSATMRMGEPAG